MDVTLVSALCDLLEPLHAAIYRCVGETGHERWLTRAKLSQGDAVASADSVWISSEKLPELDDFPARVDCMRSRQVLQQHLGDHWLTLFPIATDRSAVGVIEVSTREQLSPSGLKQVCSILRIYHNFQGLLDYSERDTLTGLLNRKTFDESFLKAMGEMPMHRDESARDGRRHEEVHPRYFLGVIDIDHFKAVNDRFGHLIGDEVLLLLSRLMRNSFRFQDLLYRFGGEEFVVLMRCEDAIDAGQAFERLRNNTANYAFPQVGRVTISIGFTEVRNGDSPAGAFERADKAVYFAKSNGRDQVRDHADLLRAGEVQEVEKVSDVELF